MHGFSSAYRAQDLSQHRRTDEDMKQKLKDHVENCFVFAAQSTEFPDDPSVEFENIQRRVEAQFTVYADVESILKEVPRTYRLFLRISNC